MLALLATIDIRKASNRRLGSLDSTHHHGNEGATPTTPTVRANSDQDMRLHRTLRNRAPQSRRNTDASDCFGTTRSLASAPMHRWNGVESDAELASVNRRLTAQGWQSMPIPTDKRQRREFWT